MNAVNETAASGYLDRLNPEQRAAVLHGDGQIAGPLLVIAGAGTGKTTTLVHRLAHLVLSGADPRRILVMTFSRRAAAEMTRRARLIAEEALGARASLLSEGLTWAGTFHAIGARLLREYATPIGLAPGFTIHDRSDSADLMNLTRHQLGLSRTERRFPAKGTCLAVYSRAVNAREPLGKILHRSFPWCAEWEDELKRLFAGYVAAKQAAHVLDYDDLLLYWAGLMEDPALGAEVAGKFDHVLVDEYQDTNRLQAEIVMHLKPDGRGVTVVGDDAQAIYAFRAAEVRNILDFPTSYTPPARVIALERNYRSTPEILVAANAIVAGAEEGYAKTLRSNRPSGPRPALVTVADEMAQVDFVCGGILAARERGVALRDQAVLFRTAHHSGPLEVDLTLRNIPFVKFGGLRFLDAAHVKDVLAVLRLAQNPSDRTAGFRVLQLVPGIGPTIAGRIADTIAGARDPTSAMVDAKVPKRVGAAWADFSSLYKSIYSSARWPADLELVRTWYDPHLERLHDDFVARRADLAQLERIASGYPSRERFLTEVTLDPPGASSNIAGVPHRDDDYLILSTIHSAKGREWRQVFVLNCVDGCVPSELSTGTQAEIEEERRLLYVAMTRARDTLHLVQPQRFYTHGQHRLGDRHVYAIPSRFIPDNPGAIFESRVWPERSASRADSIARDGPGAKTDLKERMRTMWA